MLRPLSFDIQVQEQEIEAARVNFFWQLRFFGVLEYCDAYLKRI